MTELWKLEFGRQMQQPCHVGGRTNVFLRRTSSQMKHQNRRQPKKPALSQIPLALSELTNSSSQPAPETWQVLGSKQNQDQGEN